MPFVRIRELIVFQSEVAALNELKQKVVHICPTEDLGYRKIDGRCFYFEKNKLDFENAKANCKEKLQLYGQGKLFEPNTQAENDKIAKISESILPKTWPHIGVTDMLQEGTFVYNTGLPINFSPIWYSNYGSKGTAKNCICFGDYSPYIGKWADESCSTVRPSICEA